MAGHALQDAKMFRRKKWKYLILDEAHMIKNWKSQRWQTLLNFNSKRRLLITGHPDTDIADHCCCIAPTFESVEAGKAQQSQQPSWLTFAQQVQLASHRSVSRVEC